MGILDRDGDGKLTPQECTMDFAGPLMMAVQSMAAAAPFLNEIRAKDHEIAFLRAKLAVLGATTDDLVPLELPEVEVTVEEVKELFAGYSSALSNPVEAVGNSTLRSVASKISYLHIKYYAKTLIKLTQIPMAESHDPESFFRALKTMCAECIYDAKISFGPLYKVVPKGDATIAMMDTIYNQLQTGNFDKEMRDLSGSVFRVLDQDNDGMICPADASMYTDFFFAPCPDDDSAKKKIMAIFDNLDLAKSGSLSQDEISGFASKILHFGAHAILFVLAVAEVCTTMLAEKELKAMMDFYIQDCKDNKFVEVCAPSPASLTRVRTGVCRWKIA